MAAARQDRVRARQAWAQAAGLKLQVLDSESNAALLALRAWRPPDGQLGAGEALGLVDAQPAALNLRVMAQGEFVFERSEAVGPGGSGPWWLQTLGRLLQLFHAAHAGRRLIGLALVGDHASGPDRVQWPHSVARLAGVPAWWMDPFVHLGCARVSRAAASPVRAQGPGARPEPDQACVYALACGLALRALSP
jgi:Tfp pilus assembly PilM family ATPase